MSAPTNELETVRDWIRFAVSRFTAAKLYFGHGMATAYDEATYLVLRTLSLPLDRLDPFLDARLTHSERGDVLRIIERRVEERIPAAYLTHEAWLGEFRFYVDERVIIPRSYIAELLHEGLEPWVEDAASVKNALDMCTGSGCLAVLLAHYFPNADVDAADISSDALAVALRNVTEHGMQDRINLVRSDMMSNLNEKTYDLIISNPPYVTSMSMDELPPSIGTSRRFAGRRRRWTRCGAYPARQGIAVSGAPRLAGGGSRPQPRRRRGVVSAHTFHLAHHGVQRGKRLPAETRGPRPAESAEPGAAACVCTRYCVSTARKTA